MSRMQNGVNCVSKLPTKIGYVPIRITPIKDEISDYWHNCIQPYIVADPNRTVDRSWVWPRLVRRQSYLAKALNQTLVSISLGIESNSYDVYIPIGMALLVKEYHALHDNSKRASFVWFMSTAPRTYLDQMVGSQYVPSKVGSALLDTVISLSFNSSLEGRIGLHAAPGGGQWLFDWYVNEDLKNLDKNRRLPAGRGIIQFFKQPLSGNDGRYFYTDKAAALLKSKQFDLFR